MSHETARLITDANYREFLQQQSDAGMVGFGALPRQTQPGGIVGVPMMVEKVPLIPEAEWPDRIRHMTANKLWIGDRWKSDPQADYQNGFGYCWAYSLSQAVMAVRAAQGQKFVQLSPESLAEDVNYRNAGNYLDSALEYAAKNGIATRATVPQQDQRIAVGRGLQGGTHALHSFRMVGLRWPRRVAIDRDGAVARLWLLRWPRLVVTRRLV